MRKMLATSLAAVGLAGMIGGGTFAAWNDFGSVDGNQVGAAMLQLDLTDNDGVGSANRFNSDKMAPGQNKQLRIWLGSNDGQSVPNGALGLWFDNLSDIEDLATCTTNSEALAEDTNSDPQPADCGTDGEFLANATLRIEAWEPHPTQNFINHGGQCDGYVKDGPDGVRNNGDEPVKAIDESMDLETFTTTYSQVNQYPLASIVQPGHGVCARYTIGLPGGTGNEAQGDDLSFDAQYWLEQTPAP